MEMFGDIRVDSYHWFRDGSYSNPEDLSYLKAENDNQTMSSVKQFEDQLYAEIRATIKKDDISVPTRRGKYYYYERTLQGEEYVLHCVRLITTETYASVQDAIPIEPEAPEEHVIAILHEFLRLTVGKMVNIERLSHFRRDLNMTNNLRELLFEGAQLMII